MKHKDIRTGGEYVYQKSQSLDLRRWGDRVRVVDTGPFVDMNPGSYRKWNRANLSLTNGTVLTDVTYRHKRPGERVTHLFVAVEFLVYADGEVISARGIEFVPVRQIHAPWAEYRQAKDAMKAADAAAAERQIAREDRMDQMWQEIKHWSATVGIEAGEYYSRDLRRDDDRAVVAPDLILSLLRHAAATGWVWEGHKAV
jgi:hypothetical protein